MKSIANANLIKLFCWIIFVMSTIGCVNASNNKEKKIIMNTDIVALQKFINLPAKVESCEWQTGEFAPGGDWWLAATLITNKTDISKFLHEPAKEELLELPKGIKLESTFTDLKNNFNSSTAGGSTLSFVTKVYPIIPYSKSPLLNGKAIRLADNKVFIFLWTM